LEHRQQVDKCMRGYIFLVKKIVVLYGEGRREKLSYILFHYCTEVTREGGAYG